MNDSVTIAFLGLLFLLSYGGTISSTQLLLLLALMTTAACACGGGKRTLISGLADGNGLSSGGTTTATRPLPPPRPRQLGRRATTKFFGQFYNKKTWRRKNPSPCIVMYLIYLQPQPVPQGAKPLSLQQQRISIISGTRYPQSQILSIMPLMQSQPPQFKSSMMRRYIYQLVVAQTVEHNFFNSFRYIYGSAVII